MFRRKKEAKKSTSSQASDEDRIEELIEAGGVRAIVTFEIVGKPKEHVENSLREYLSNIKKDARITILSEEVADAEENDGMWSTFAEVELVVNELNTLVWLCINFSPASVEIQEPSERRVSAAMLNAWLNDLLSKLHEIGMDYRNTAQKNKSLNESLNALIKNGIITSLESGNHDAKAIQKRLGIHKDQLKPFLDHLVERGRIKQAGETYSLG